jgi:hypothetical protein
MTISAAVGSNLTKLDSVTFDTLLANQDPLSGTGAVDLSGVRLITPAAMVQLAVLAHALDAQGKQCVITIDDESVRSYLGRAGFGSIVEERVAVFEPPLSGTYACEYLRGSNPMLIELTKVVSGDDLPELLDQIVAVLGERLQYAERDAFDAAIAASEIFQNTFDHNEDSVGFVAMQVYGRGSDRFLELGVADNGSGLAETLRRNPEHANLGSDLEAIKRAATLGVSEHRDPTRGTGLHHLLEIAYRHQGNVQIRSGAAKVRFRFDKRKGWGFSVPHLGGVQIALTLRSKASTAE